MIQMKKSQKCTLHNESLFTLMSLNRSDCYAEPKPHTDQTMNLTRHLTTSVFFIIRLYYKLQFYINTCSA